MVTPTIRVCRTSKPAQHLEVQEIERFSDNRGEYFQISGGPVNLWLIVDRKFMEACAKALDMEPGAIKSVDKL